jgi:hypothetical protein
MCAKRIPGRNTGDFTELTERLTSRDYDILETLELRKIMTAGMLEALFFPSRHQAGARLLTLFELGLLDRWRSPESKAYRYVLGWRGQHIRAAIKGEKPPRKQDAIFQAQHRFLSQHRAHTEGVNAFFCRLYYSARNRSDVKVKEWSDLDLGVLSIKPDGTGEVSWQDGQTLRFWLEHDRGTETLKYLARKITSYNDKVRRYVDRRDTVLLFELSSQRRLRNFLPVATDTWKSCMAEWENPSLIVGISIATQNERTFTHPEEFPDAFNDRRWQILGWSGTYNLTELPTLAAEMRNPNRPA